jgi:hypothetical protein
MIQTESVSPAVAGFECRACGCRDFRVVYTRPTNRGVTRVRACRHCGRRIVTRETVAGEPSRGEYRSRIPPV